MSMENRKKKRGDRREGRRLRSLDPYLALTPFIMETRQDASNSFADKIEITDVDRFIRKKRAEGLKGFGLLHVFVASYVRTVSQRPAINRFVSGKRIFARNNIEVVMTIKKEMTSTGSETSIKVVFQPGDTVDDVYRKMTESIISVKDDNSTSTDNVANAIIKLPGFLLSFFIWLVKRFDYHGWLPQVLIDASPFHGSIVITDLGSLGIPPVAHHLYDLGNVPVFLAIGAKRRVFEPDVNNSVSERKYIDYTVVSDERICDGFYFAQSLKYLRSYFRNPEQLEKPPEQIFEDVD